MDTLFVLLRREAAAAWRNRWIALAAAWLICIGGWVGVWILPDQYEANARLYVDADAVLTPLLRGLALDTASAGQVEVLQRTLLSRPNLEKLISKTDLDLRITSPFDLERMVANLGNQIKLASQGRDLFTISYRDTNPRLAYDVVRTLVTTFVESTVGNTRVDLEKARQFLQTQIETYEQQLRAAEKRRAEFKTEYVDLLPSEASGQTRLETQESAIVDLRGRLQDAIDQRDRLTKELAATPPLLVTENDEAGGGRGSSTACITMEEQKLQDLLVRLTDKAPEVIAQRSIIAARKASGCGDVPVGSGSTVNISGPRSRSVPNPVFGPLKEKLIDVQAQVASLNRQIDAATHERDRLRENARAVPGLQAQAANLNRDYDVIRKNYEELIARRESMKIAAAAETGADKVKLEIVDPPKLPRIPVAPKRTLLVPGVLAAGLLGGLGVAVLLSRLDTSFHGVDDLASLGLAVIGGISLRAAAQSVRQRVLTTVAFAVPVLVLCTICGGLLYALVRGQGAA